MEKKDTITVTLLRQTVERLKDAGRKGDTYDTIIQRLLDAREAE
jgi:hypothetical protein